MDIYVAIFLFAILIIFIGVLAFFIFRLSKEIRNMEKSEKELREKLWDQYNEYVESLRQKEMEISKIRQEMLNKSLQLIKSNDKLIKLTNQKTESNIQGSKEKVFATTSRYTYSSKDPEVIKKMDLILDEISLNGIHSISIEKITYLKLIK